MLATPTSCPCHGYRRAVDKASANTSWARSGTPPRSGLHATVDAMSRHSVEQSAGSHAASLPPSPGRCQRERRANAWTAARVSSATALLHLSQAAAPISLPRRTECTVHRPFHYKKAQASSAQTTSPPYPSFTTRPPPQRRGSPLLPTDRGRARRRQAHGEGCRRGTPPFPLPLGSLDAPWFPLSNAHAPSS